ncbi:hypothetical protein [Actinoallomurus acaciae]|uniref:LppX_LprAFG lipoprotein n=1 Tax=Actinoallomurus acaciae TaxID=502577 RepID=A0ABV5Y8J1_9ACTN
MTMAGRCVAGAAGLALVVSLMGCSANGNRPGRAGDSPVTAAEAMGQAASRLRSVQSYQASVSVSTVVGSTRKHLFGEMTSRSKDQALKYDVPFFDKDGNAISDSTQILLGDRLYIKNQVLLEVIHKSWIGIPLGGLKPADTHVTALLAQIHQPDPLLHARMFTASRDVHLVGRETTGGTPTTRYQGTFVLSDALARLDAPERTEAQAVYGPFGTTPYFEVWIDDHRLVRKINIVSRRGAKHRVNATVNYSTFDTPVSIAAPPSNDLENLPGSATENIPI